MWILELTFFSCLSKTGGYKLQQKSLQVSFMEKDLKTKEDKLQQNHDRIHTQKNSPEENYFSGFILASVDTTQNTEVTL